MNQANAGSDGGTPVFDGETPEITAAEVKGYLKAVHMIVSQPARLRRHINCPPFQVSAT